MTAQAGGPYAGFGNALWNIVSARTAAKSLKAYLDPSKPPKYSGRAFDSFAHCRFDPFRIVGDDVVAVTMLSIGITQAGNNLSPEMLLSLEEHSPAVSSLLHQIPPHLQLHKLTQADANDLLFNRNSPGSRLWYTVHDALKAGAANNGSRPVATYKLLARKRPHLFPIRDGKTKNPLGNATPWWTAWWTVLTGNPRIVAKLTALRANEPLAAHLSLLRVADIVVWMSQPRPPAGAGAGGAGPAGGPSQAGGTAPAGGPSQTGGPPTVWPSGERH